MLIATRSPLFFLHYSENLRSLGVNVESNSDHSDKVTSEDEAESTSMKEDVNSTAENVPAQSEADQEVTSYRLRNRPAAKKLVSRMYGTIVGAENLTKPTPRKSTRADSTAAPTRAKWTAKLVNCAYFLFSTNSDHAVLTTSQTITG